MSVLLQPIELNEKSKSADLMAQLEAVPLGRMYQASFKAMVRLHLWFTGFTHELFGEFMDEARALVLKRAGKDQALDGSEAFQLQTALLIRWGDTFKTWQDTFYRVRVEAGSIPFGVLAVSHERLVVTAVSDQRSAVSEQRAAISDQQSAVSGQRTAISESVADGVFSPQLRTLLNAAGEYLYGDSLNLSARVWRVDREARDGIATVILQGVTNQASAWQIAQDLEQFLGANEDCPRWTSTRLYQRTKTQIAQGDTTGLVSKPCDGRGVSYNALRLARTELQKVHALATDRIMAAQPWVEKERVHLSEAHPEPDICDDKATGGEEGKGIYEVGTVELPLHPNCLCYKTAVLMDEKEFTSRLQGWLKGEQDWGEMDEYSQAVSGQRSVGGEGLEVSLLPNAVNLAVWLFGDSGQLSAFSGQRSAGSVQRSVFGGGAA